MISVNLLRKFLLLCLTLLLFFIDPYNFSYIDCCILTLIDLGFCLYVIKGEGELCLKSPKCLFWFITVLFSLGQNIAYPFISNDMEFFNELLYGFRRNDGEMCLSSVYTMQALNMFTLGLYYCKRNSKFEKVIEEYNIAYITNRERMFAISAHYIGIFLLSISFIPELLYVYAEVVLYFTQGYGQTSNAQLSGIVLVLHYLFIPAILMSYCGCHYLSKSKMAHTVILIGLAFIFLLIGDRGSGISLLVSFLWLKLVMDKSFQIRKYVMPLLIIVLAIPIIKYYRISYTSNSENPFFDAVYYIVEHNPIIDILLETGASQNVLIMTMEKVVSSGLAYGSAYINFFIRMLPGFLGIEQEYASLAKWVIGTTEYQTQGFSIWAEAYLNFGDMGIPFMFIIGLMFNFMLRVETSSVVIAAIRISICLAMFSDIARRSIAEYGHNFMYDLVVPIILIHILANYLKKYRYEKFK